MLFISACVFALAIILEATTNASAVILNMIDVFAWVFTWEAVDIFFFQRPKLHKEQQRNVAAIDAEIVFVDSNEDWVNRRVALRNYYLLRTQSGFK